MPQMSYDTGQLRDGGRVDRQASTSAENAASAVSGGSVAAGAFGNVAPAGSIAGALADAQRQHARAATVAAGNLNVQGERADTAADAGDQLTAATTSIANSGIARRVADGMS